MEGETYWDIVWRMFKKNRLALWSMWILALLFLIAIFAPAIASNQPLTFWDGEQTLYPWVRALFNPETTVDFMFNMAFVAFPFWVAVSLFFNRRWKIRQVPGRTRVFRVAVIYVVLLLLLCFICGVVDVRPNNPYWARTFTEEEFESGGEKHGTYVLVPFGSHEQDTASTFRPPFHVKPEDQWKDSNDGVVHLLGTDNTGRDVLVLLIYGLRISLTVGFVAVGIYLTIGVIVGAIAGFFGGWVDMVISRVIEIVLLFPAFFLILTLVALMGPSIYIIMVVIGVTGWPTVARLIRGEVLKQRKIEYVMAAQALGTSPFRIIFRHILPNALSPALVSAPFGVARAIIVEGGLNVLGFGVRPPTPSWGTLLNLASGNYSYWWLVLFPSIGMFVAVTIFNLIGAGLRDAMDPRLRM